MKDSPVESSIKRGDAGTIKSATQILEGSSKKGRLGRLMPFLGPAFIASVAYVDPGNFATNIQGGAKFGYLLLWVIVASNLMAMLLQTLSAKLGIASNMNLAELCRVHFPRRVVFLMWVLMEIVAMATDLAEFLGAALGFNLLFGVPLWIAGFLTAIATFLILGLERQGFRPLEAVISILVGTVAISYVIETFLDKPAWGQVFHHAVVPQFSGTESILLATGILGATVMPHAIILHSALTQGRIVVKDPVQLRRLFRFQIIDVLVAMSLASLVNAAMLIMAASTFHVHGLSQVGSIQEAHRTLEPLLGSAASTVFGISLLASGSVLSLGRYNGRAGDHAGLFAPPHRALAAPSGDDDPLPGRDRYWAGPDAHAGDQPGCAQFWPALCGDTPGDVHAAARCDGRADQPLDHNNGGQYGCRTHCGVESVSAVPDLFRRVAACLSICWFHLTVRGLPKQPCQPPLISPRC